MNEQATKTILVVGNDKIGARAMAEACAPDVKVFLDCSSSLGRVFRLIVKRRIRLGLVLKMFLAELKRPRVERRVKIAGEIRSNKDLLAVLSEYSPERVVLFRAGLIINKSVIASGIPLMNIHCAQVPEYGGLGSIDRALRDGAYTQEATLHQVTVSIDEGEVYDTESYEMDGNMSYSENENRAYEAGIELLKRTLRGFCNKTEQNIAQ